MFNTNFSSQPARYDGYDEYEAEIERQLAALGPLDEKDLIENDEDVLEEPPRLELVDKEQKEESPIDSWKVFLEASKKRDDQLQTWKLEFTDDIGDIAKVALPAHPPKATESLQAQPLPSSPHPLSSPSLSSQSLPSFSSSLPQPPLSFPSSQLFASPSQALLSSHQPVTAAMPIQTTGPGPEPILGPVGPILAPATHTTPLALEQILQDLKELQQQEQSQQASLGPGSNEGAGHAPSALDRERMQIEREIEARDRMRREDEERARREREVEEQRREIEKRREEEEARIAEEGRKLREKMEEVKRAREEMLRVEKEREIERLRLMKENEEERKRKQEEERIREEEEEKERRRVIEEERKARMERESKKREEVIRRKKEEERLALIKAEQERKEKEEQVRIKKEQERKRMEEDAKRRELLEKKRRELEVLKQQEAALRTNKAKQKERPPRDVSTPSDDPSAYLRKRSTGKATPPSSTLSSPSPSSPSSPSTPSSPAPKIHTSAKEPKQLARVQSPLPSPPSSPSPLPPPLSSPQPPSQLPLLPQQSPQEKLQQYPSLHHSQSLHHAQSLQHLQHSKPELQPLQPTQTAHSGQGSLSARDSQSLCSSQSAQDAQGLQFAPHAQVLQPVQGAQGSQPALGSPLSQATQLALQLSQNYHTEKQETPVQPMHHLAPQPYSDVSATSDSWLEDHMRASNARLYQSSVSVASTTKTSTPRTASPTPRHKNPPAGDLGASDVLPTSDSWLEDHMRASNARLYQSSASVANATKASTPRSSNLTPRHKNLPSGDASTALAADPEHPKIIPQSPSPATPKRLHTGVTLSTSMIESHFPTVPLNAITHLDLSLESISKIDNLDHCPNLRSLLLNTNSITSLEGLAPCSLLVHLELKDNPLSLPLSFPPLPSLASLSLDVCKIPDFDGSELIPNLHSVSVSGNRLTSFRGLARCPKISHLAARHNRLADLTHGANGFPNLLTLDVSSNHLTSLPDLETWSPLVGCVIASTNRIRAWPSALRAPLLRELHLNFNAIDAFGPIGFLPLLRFLDLSDNHITCIEWVGGCPLLDTLLLSRNEIAAFSALRSLAALRELRTLRLDGNPVASSILYPNSLHDMCPTLENIDGNPFEPGAAGRTAAPIVLSPGYVAYWLQGAASASAPSPIEKETPAWWNFNALLKMCKKLSLEASEITTRCKAANFAEQNQIGEDEVMLSRVHLTTLQALGRNPEIFLDQILAKPLQRTPEEHAAIKMQSLWRGRVCRAKLGLSRVYGVRHVRAAVQLQKVWRGFHARSKSIFCARKVIKQNAALAIQKVWRGFVVRNTMKKARQAVRAAFAEYGNLEPAPSFEIPAMDELELNPPDDDFEAFLMDESPILAHAFDQISSQKIHAHYSVETQNQFPPRPEPRHVSTTVVLVQEKPPTPVIPRLSLEQPLPPRSDFQPPHQIKPPAQSHFQFQSQFQSQPQSQLQPQSHFPHQPQQAPPRSQSPSPSTTRPTAQSAAQPAAQATAITGDTQMDAIAKEWNFKDPRTLELLQKREKKRNGPNRAHQQMPIRRATSHEHRIQQPILKNKGKEDVHSQHSQDESDECLSAKSDPSGAHYALPRRGRYITPVPANTLSISPTPPPAFLPSLKPSPHASAHHASSGKRADASKKLPPIAKG